jgi:dienelactone hydrolase
MIPSAPAFSPRAAAWFARPVPAPRNRPVARPRTLRSRLAPWTLALLLGCAAPLSAPAQLQVSIANPAPTTFQLGWQDLGPTRAYTVQYRDNLGDAIWLNAPHAAPWPLTAPLWTDPRTNPAPTRFYRVLSVERPRRGEVIASELLETLSAADLTLLMSLAGIPLTAQYGVGVFKLSYETIDPHGGRALASGVFALPLGAGGPLPLVSYQHGTLVLTNEAPSAQLLGESFVGLGMAGSGYVAVLPDYLGLGDSPPLHPFVHARSEASASVDLLRAARTFCASNSVALSGKLFICGYSQGGHATMALHREIETYHADEFTITASAPMAGPYDMSGTTLNDFLSSRPKPNPYYLAYLVAAYQEVYHFAPTLADLLRPPYNTTLPPLLRGNASSDQLNAAMPADPRQIIKPELLAAIQTRPDHPFRAALRDNDLYDWKPVAPMRLYHCGGDQDILIANAHFTTNAMHRLGATNVTLHIPSPTLTHGACAQPSLLAAKAWFDTLK